MKSVLVTGAAQGIGLAIATRFAEAGWLVGLFDTNADACRALLQRPPFGRSVAGYCDVTDRDSVSRALSEFGAISGHRLNVLINNAGVLTSGPFESLTPEQVDAMIAVNITGLTQVSQLAFPLLRDTPDSMVINLCSASSIHGIPWLGVYSASKFYVNGLTQALSLEWSEHDIHVTCLKPVPINTAMGMQLEERHTKNMAINIEPEAVADVAFRAVSYRRPHHFVGRSAWWWHLVNRLLPMRLRERLVRSLIGS